MRLAPDLSLYNDEMPDLEELAPEEIRYLCDLCRFLARHHACKGVTTPREQTQVAEAFDDDVFDRDELGIPPEEDEECLS